MRSVLSSSEHELLLHLFCDLGSIEAVCHLCRAISLSRHCWSRSSVRIQDLRLHVVSPWPLIDRIDDAGLGRESR